MQNPVQYHYGKFPPQNVNWERLIPLIGPANAAIARYDGKLSAVPNAWVLLTPLSTQEAVLSSKIEGTQATIGEVLEFEAEGEERAISIEKKSDIKEILNYREAMSHATVLLEKLPLSQRLIRETHCKLMEGVRGHNKCPGDYRKVPNWIGPPGCSIDEAKFVPISADKLADGMSEWEKYIHKGEPDRLVQLAITHAEFEALHPFLDGNGRLGRMCVPLFMYKSGLISRPIFYISAYFEAHRDSYYNRLLAISKDDDWTGWCEFFLNAVLAQAEENDKKTTEIINLYDSLKDKMREITHSQFSINALEFIFRRMIFKATDFSTNSGIPRPSTVRILAALRENGLLKVIREARGRRPAIYIFSDLFNIVEGRQIF